MPRQPTSLFSPKAAAPGNLPLPAFGGLAAGSTPGSSSGSASTRHHTPVRGREGAGDSNDNAGAETPGGVMRPSKLFGTPMATATPQQQASTGLLRRPADMHATPTQADAAAATPEVPPPAAGVKVRKLTFDSAVKTPAARAGAAAGAAGEVKPGGIKFELGGSALAVSWLQVLVARRCTRNISSFEEEPASLAPRPCVMGVVCNMISTSPANYHVVSLPSSAC
jgi:hypothetical protein